MPEYKYPGYGATTENWLTPRADTEGGYHGGSDNPAKPGTPVYAQYGGEIFRSDPPNPDQASAGGLLGLIQDYMRNNGY